MKYQTTTEHQTFALGKKLAQTLRGGELILLQGELGSGKTVLAKGIGAGLGIRKTITSPTFFLFNIYPVKKHPTIKRLVHADCYRLKSGRDIVEAGLGDYLGQADTVVVVEWGEKLPRKLQQGVRVHFRVLKNQRSIVVS
ncbi:tRNA (adenosine(37)-N6)-threonylcarbamoyltransferase complex ATPase subunit type 1 TsaE [Candidatus Falkowbacteria bacterium]|nr:tRNA (adenosine(37)-N6)-threonylcarbamoyltransferase complex ATPase subunit type 1 TsaE [Candidatus Falkowbacteria bacterium]